MAKQYLLTDREVKQAHCPDGKGFIYLNDGNGLRLRVRENGTKTWLHRWKINGQEKSNSLGSYPDISLTQARELKAKDQILTKQGKNPSLERKIHKYTNAEASKAIFYTIGIEWMDSNKSNWSDTHYERTLALIENHLDILRNIPISSINDELILQCILGIQKKGLMGTISKAKSIIRCVFQYAIAKKLTNSNPVLTITGNPLIKKHKPSHFKAIKRDDVGELMYKISKTGKEQPLDLVTISAIYLSIYTGLRNKSIRGAKWEEINFSKKKWSIPGERMKLGNDFEVPLPSQAVSVLKKLKSFTFIDDKSYVFQSRRDQQKHISENTVREAIQSLGFDATQHGMRTLIQTTLLHFGYSSDAVDRQLDHVVENKNRRAYMGSEDFMEQRIKFMQFFADWCDDQHMLYKKKYDKTKDKS